MSLSSEIRGVQTQLERLATLPCKNPEEAKQAMVDLQRISDKVMEILLPAEAKTDEEENEELYRNITPGEMVQIQGMTTTIGMLQERFAGQLPSQRLIDRLNQLAHDGNS